MLIAIVSGFALVGLTSFMHFHALHALSRLGPETELRTDRRVLYCVLALFGVHAMQISLYACALWLASDVLSIGSFSGVHSGSALDFFYISIVSYTSLGIGDIIPTGHTRLLVGLEALNGLLLITWSASFLYMVMERQWHSPNNRDPL